MNQPTNTKRTSISWNERIFIIDSSTKFVKRSSNYDGFRNFNPSPRLRLLSPSVTGWWLNKPLWKICVNWDDDYSQLFLETSSSHVPVTTNQILFQLLFFLFWDFLGLFMGKFWKFPATNQPVWILTKHLYSQMQDECEPRGSFDAGKMMEKCGNLPWNRPKSPEKNQHTRMYSSIIFP